MTKPSWQDFGTHDESIVPELWNGVVGAWAPCLGPTGSRLHDMSRRSNWGTLTNMDQATDWVVSDGQYALDFDGVNDRVETNARYDGQFISVSCWVRIGFAFDSDNFPCFVGACTDQGTAGWVVYYVTSLDKFGFFVGTNLASSGAFSPQIMSNTDLKKDLWQHFCGTCDGQVVKLFRDGIEVGAGNFSGTYATSLNTVSIGDNTNFTGPPGPCLGALDDICIYNRPLSANEIRQLYQLGRGGMYQRRRRSRIYIPQAGFQAAWALRRSQIIGGGLR